MIYKAVIFLLMLAVAVCAQDHVINWYTMDSGGATVTGGVHRLSGTIGQSDVTVFGSNVVLRSGFWGFIAAVQTPGAPWLDISLVSTNIVIISWPHPSGGYQLEDSAALSGVGWSVVTNTPVVEGDTKRVTVPYPAHGRFYRLHKP
ncbi:MAG: hypothetical protein KJ626_01190 [Verrucomicrobia bacterium]|nr:hypothetical protein [Verrucomicrobiota bacterium]